MAAVAMKHMALNFAKLDKFEGVDFRRWQKKMHFLLSSMSVVDVLTTPIPEDGGDDAIVEQIRKRAKMLNLLKNYRILWRPNIWLRMHQVRSSLLVISQIKMTDSRPVLEQYNELLGILGRFTQHKMNMDESIQVSCIIDKLSPSWKYFKHTLKHLKRELTLVELGSHLRIEESLRMQDSDKPKGNNVAGPSVVNMCGKPGHLKKDCKGGKFGNKADGSGTNGSVDGSTNSLKGQNMFNKSFHVYYVTYVSEAYYVQDDDVDYGSILHMGNESTALVHGCGCFDLKFSSGKIVSLLNIVNDNIVSAFMSTSKLNYSILWHARLDHVHVKRMQDMSKDGLIPAFDMDTENDLCDMHATPSLGNKKYFVTFIDDASRAVVRLPNPKLKTLGERGIECIFVGYAKHSKAFRFYVIEPNDSVSINSIIESRDIIFDENRFSLVPRPSLKIPNGTEDIGGSVVSEEVTEEVVQQPEPELRKSKKNRTPKDFGPEFQLYLIEKTRDEVANLLVVQMDLQKKAEVARISTIRLLIAMALIYSLIIHQIDVKTAFLNSELNEEVYMKQPQGFIMLGNENKVDLTKEFLLSRFSMKDMGEADVILGIRIKHKSNGIAISQSHYIEKAVSQLGYSRVIGCLMYAMTYTRHNIAFYVGKLSRLRYTGYPSVLEGYTDVSWISNTKDNSSTSGWVFLLGGGAISWDSKKQTCITSSIMEFEFMALAVAGKEAKCAATLAKPYSQMYNEKSRHLGVRHSMIRELITNGVHMYLHIIPMMCLEPAEKEDEVVSFLMVNFFEKVLSRSMNKEEPPMYSNGLKSSILRTP
ncbi:zinc finger, CCHC-type containing protein [Tanacetum coccineum]